MVAEGIGDRRLGRDELLSDVHEGFVRAVVGHQPPPLAFKQPRLATPMLSFSLGDLRFRLELSRATANCAEDATPAAAVPARTA